MMLSSSHSPFIRSARSAAVRDMVLVEMGIFFFFFFGAASSGPSVMNASASLTGLKEGDCCTWWLLSGVEVKTASVGGDATGVGIDSWLLSGVEVKAAGVDVCCGAAGVDICCGAAGVDICCRAAGGGICCAGAGVDICCGAAGVAGSDEWGRWYLLRCAPLTRSITYRLQR